jgi:hypothetical protein
LLMASSLPQALKFESQFPSVVHRARRSDKS